ncbi:MAG TPA: tetratricopeptide repeat protein [bacterium]|nr:tetratricopeptide repeat protein [bacterium]
MIFLKKGLLISGGIISMVFTFFPSVVFAQDISNTPAPTVINFQNQETQKSYFVKDKTLIPSFYIWRRIYKKKGKSDFEFYRVDSNGNINTEKKPSVSYEDWRLSWKAETGANPDSPDKKWKVQIPGDEDWGKDILHLEGLTQSQNLNIKIPGIDPDRGAWGWMPIGWNPKMDYFYFQVVEGDSTGRDCVFYQLNPASKTMTVIGVGTYMTISPNGKWCLWIDGSGGEYCAIRQIHLYDIISNKDYTITDKRSMNWFYGWAEPGSVNDSQDAISLIESAKSDYRNHDYEKAIGEYQKAIQADPQNSEAYGLMGYSYYRDKKIIQAIDALQTSLKINPNELMSYYNLAIVYWANGEKSNSIEQLKILFEHNPKYEKLIKQDNQFNTILKSPEYQTMMAGLN